MLCTSCGLEITGEVFWAVYAWDVFAGHELEAMALHEECFTAGEYIDAAWWENDPVTNEAILRTERQQRLMRAPGEGLYIWGTDPETGEPALIPFIYPRTARG